jgi:glutamate/tyrosine decarboxylase-like PLP-dependent enzyme
MGVFGEALAAALNPHCDVGNHAAVYLELRVLDWFKQMLHFPPESRGLLVSGGSVANLTALAVARHAKAGYDVRRDGLQGADAPLVAYVSEEGHSCLRKAAELLGIGSRNVRVVRTDAEFRMDVDELRSRILVDQAAGARPFAVVASAGATNTGAIDPLARIAEVCRLHGLWLHVDGAYGGPAAMSRQYSDELGALELADSVAMDPHKWLQIPVEAGVVLVRDGAAMRDAFSLVPPYLRMDGDPDGVEGPTSFAEFGIQQTRGFRALKIWMALRSWGRDGMRAIIERNIDQARRLHRLVEAAPDLESMAPPSLSVVCFRYVPRSLRGDEERLDELNRRLVRRIQLGGDAFLGGTLVRGRYAVRACIVNHLTTDEDVEAVLDLVRREGAALAPQVETYELADVTAHMARPDDDGWPPVLDASMMK